MKQLVVVLFVVVAATACKSKEAKIEECHAQCAELDKTYAAKCPDMMIPEEECAKKTAELGKGCRETCDKGIQ